MVLLPAHGRPFEDAQGRVAELRRHHLRRKDQIVELVGEGEVTAWALAIELWGDRPHFFEKRLALQEALAHLQSLAVENRLQKLAERDLVTWRRPRPRPA